VKLHELKPARGAKHRRKRVGRGNASGTGKTSGRGQKGQKARNTVGAGFEGGQIPLDRHLPKWGGFTSRGRVEFEVVNISRLDDEFEGGETVTPEALTGKRIVRKGRPVKVLARGDISKALTVRANKFSKQAAEKIKAAGGTAEVI
jgi:large subunit ribosomal protein L15